MPTKFRLVILAIGLACVAMLFAVPAEASTPARLTKQDARAVLVSLYSPEANSTFFVQRYVDPTVDGSHAYIPSTPSARKLGRSAVLYPVTFLLNRDGNADIQNITFLVRHRHNGATVTSALRP